MTTDARRREYLDALGLTDWQYRPDGPLDARPGSVAGSTIGPSEMAETDPVSAGPPRLEAAPDAAVPRADETSPEPPEATSEAGPAGADRPEAMDWEDLEAYLARQDHRGATQPVFGIGARDADVLIVGEAPGANEDAHGMPFVGRAGKLLDRMLFAIGCSRATNVYITNICKFRPPGNRDPKPEEVAADWPILERQIDLMAPKLVVAVGRVAAQTLLDCDTPLGKMRGRLHRYPRRELDVLVTYHPAFLLRSPQQKSKAWADLKMIATHIRAFDR